MDTYTKGRLSRGRAIRKHREARFRETELGNHRGIEKGRYCIIFRIREAFNLKMRFLPRQKDAHQSPNPHRIEQSLTRSTLTGF